MYKRSGKDRSKSGAPKLKTGEILMLVCQGAVLRVQNPIDNLDYFDLDAPKYAEKIEISNQGHIEITFAKGYEKQGYAKWLYEVDVTRKALEATKPC